MIENVAISEVMSKNPITLHPKESIENARKLFRENDIRHIPLVVFNKVVGILSLGDLLYMEGIKNRSRDKHLSSTVVGVSFLDDVMTLDPVCLNIENTLADALLFMIEKRINCLPIVDDQKELKGLITTHDINRFLLSHLKPA